MIWFPSTNLFFYFITNNHNGMKLTQSIFKSCGKSIKVVCTLIDLFHWRYISFSRKNMYTRQAGTVGNLRSSNLHCRAFTNTVKEIRVIPAAFGKSGSDLQTHNWYKIHFPGNRGNNLFLLMLQWRKLCPGGSQIELFVGVMSWFCLHIWKYVCGCNGGTPESLLDIWPWRFYLKKTNERLIHASTHWYKYMLIILCTH